MKLFPSTDYTFCNSKICEKQFNCIRHTRHYAFNDMRLSILAHEVDETSGCIMFIDGEKNE